MMNKDSKRAADRSRRDSTGEAGDAIAAQLKQYYKSVEQEPIPANLLDLLEQLDQAERSGGSDGSH
ncbi:NepR family anti-sigma factor [Hoeflea sp.]|uniref:NepR family anti-sigma factor n=1 Tax=Hoeflea sp. TaxID=1940281 RepID=UPI00374968FE